MRIYRFSTGVEFMWNAYLYKVVKPLPDGQLNIEEQMTGATQVLPARQLKDAWYAGELYFVDTGSRKNDHAGKKEPPTLRFDLSDYPEDKKAKARFRLRVIEPLLSIARRKRSQAVIEARIAEVKAEIEKDLTQACYLRGLTVRNVRRWIQRYLSGGQELLALIDDDFHRGGRHTSRLAPVVQTIVDAVITDLYKSKRENVTIGELRDEIARRLEDENHLRTLAEQLELPSDGAIRRRIDALDMRAIFTTKHGARAARHQFDQVGQMEYPTQPLERVEMDDTNLDLIVIDENDGLALGRATLSWNLCLGTRYIPGFYVGFEPPSYYTVMECLFRSICPKGDIQKVYGTEHPWIAEGIPQTLVVDNGRQYAGKDLEDACESLGITLVYSPVRRPEFKAGVERAFRTLNTGLIHSIPGTTFSNIMERGDYDSVGKAIVTLPDLEKLITTFIVDYYAENYHRGLDGIPARRWEAAMQAGFTPRLPASRDELLILLGRVEHRLITRTGIDLFCLRYNSPDLSSLRIRMKGQQVKVKYHPGDLSKIHVADPFENVYIDVPALDQEYTTDLSLWKHNCILELLHQDRAKVDHAALGRAKEQMRDIVDAARSRRRSTRAQVARWDRSGQPPSMTAKAVTGATKPKRGSKPKPAVAPVQPLPAPNNAASKKPKGNGDDWEMSYASTD